MLRKIATIIMVLPVFAAAILAFSAAPCYSIPVELVHRLTDDEIALLLQEADQLASTEASADVAVAQVQD